MEGWGVGVEGVWVNHLFFWWCPARPSLTPGVFHKGCIITSFVGVSWCNGSGGGPC